VIYLIDSDWLIDVFVGIPRAVEILRALRPRGLGISIVSHAEIFEGAFGYPDTPDRLARYRLFLQQFDTLPLSSPIAEIFGHARSDLRRAGQLIPDLDLLIGATALHHDLILLTRNRQHFTRIPGLRIFESGDSVIGT
jgi:tRNA(fMet)-specific endonuclease VapC